MLKPLTKSQYLTGGVANLALTLISIYHKHDKKVSILVISHKTGLVVSSLTASTRWETRNMAEELFLKQVTKYEAHGEALFVSEETEHVTIITSPSFVRPRTNRQLTESHPWLKIVKFSHKTNKVPLTRDVLMMYNSHISIHRIEEVTALVNGFIRSRLNKLPKDITDT